jgi:hypothetical protein
MVNVEPWHGKPLVSKANRGGRVDTDLPLVVEAARNG